MPKLPLPMKYTVRLLYDDDSVRAQIVVDGQVVGHCGYCFTRQFGGWDGARKEAMQTAANRIAEIERFGLPPMTAETVPLEQLPEPKVMGE